MPTASKTLHWIRAIEGWTVSLHPTTKTFLFADQNEIVKSVPAKELAAEYLKLLLEKRQLEIQVANLQKSLFPDNGKRGPVTAATPVPKPPRKADEHAKTELLLG